MGTNAADQVRGLTVPTDPVGDHDIDNKKNDANTGAIFKRRMTDNSYE